MDAPNAITATRFLLAVVGAIVLLVLPPPVAYPVALVIFVIAAISDWLDGALARRLGRFSALGAFMDPLADKVIIYMYFVYLASLGVYPVWLLMVFLARDLIHDAYRAYAASMRTSVPANLLGKIKTALQMVSIVSALAALLWTNAFLGSAAVFLMVVALISGLCGAVKTFIDYHQFFSQAE